MALKPVSKRRQGERFWIAMELFQSSRWYINALLFRIDVEKRISRDVSVSVNLRDYCLGVLGGKYSVQKRKEGRIRSVIRNAYLDAKEDWEKYPRRFPN